MELTVNNANEWFLKVIYNLKNNSDYISHPRWYETIELLNVGIKILNPRDRIVYWPARNISFRYLLGEWLRYCRWSDSLEEISHYSSFWKKISDNWITANSGYWKYIFTSDKWLSQWNYVKQVLSEDSFSRRAIINIYNYDPSYIASKDIPCTMSLQFLIRENKLHLIAHMRSNDIYLWYCYDVPSFTLLQEMMLLELWQSYPELEMWYYYHFANSMHIYKKNFSVLDCDQDKNDVWKVIMPQINSLSEIEELIILEKIVRTWSQADYHWDSLFIKRCLSFLQSN